MKENKYDDPVFFRKYSEMNRSKQGLQGAGEWETLKAILPNMKKKTILDLGCGYGWHCEYAVNQGAKSVIGVDLSENMLGVAKKKTEGMPVTYMKMAMEDITFPEQSFDIVFSSLAFHYVPKYEQLVKKIALILKTGGQLIFSVEHPVFTAYGSQDWYYDEEGKIQHFPVDNYYYEGKRNACFLGEQVIKYHRTLTTYLETLLKYGFVLEHIIEPKPPENMMMLPGMKDEMRRPMMLIISAQKKKC